MYSFAIMIKILFYKFVTVNIILNFIWNYVYYIYLIKLSLINLFSKLFSTLLESLLTVFYLNLYVNFYFAEITALTHLYSNIYFKTGDNYAKFLL